MTDRQHRTLVQLGLACGRPLCYQPPQPYSLMCGRHAGSVLPEGRWSSVQARLDDTRQRIERRGLVAQADLTSDIR